MPIQDRKKTLIKFKSEGYNSVQEFLDDTFYKDKTGGLSKASYEFIRKVYERKDEGLLCKNWKHHVAELFSLELLNAEEQSRLEGLCKKHLGDVKTAKPFDTILKKIGSGAISTSNEEKLLLEKVFKWNSAVSSYYSIVNKLKAIGLIEKKNGKYFKSETILRQLDTLKSMITTLHSTL